MAVPSKEAKTSGTAGIDAEGGRRPAAVPAPAAAASELLDRSRRQTFTELAPDRFKDFWRG
jgi:hypothetical protein